MLWQIVPMRNYTRWLKQFFRMFSLALGLKSFILCPLSVLTVRAYWKNVDALTFSSSDSTSADGWSSPLSTLTSSSRSCHPRRPTANCRLLTRQRAVRRSGRVRRRVEIECIVFVPLSKQEIHAFIRIVEPAAGQRDLLAEQLPSLAPPQPTNWRPRLHCSLHVFCMHNAKLLF